MVDLKGYGVGLYLHAQAVDTTTPGGKALLQMAGVFAEFEREMIRERVLAGQARARASGVRFGRPTIPADKAAAIVADLKAGVGVVKLAKLHGVGVGTVQKLKVLSPRKKRRVHPCPPPNPPTAGMLEPLHRGITAACTGSQAVRTAISMRSALVYFAAQDIDSAA
jgi:hypothetical protein